MRLENEELLVCTKNFPQNYHSLLTATEIAALAVSAPVIAEEVSRDPLPIVSTIAPPVATPATPRNTTGMPAGGLASEAFTSELATTSTFGSAVESPVISPTATKSKRGSVFGSFFNRKESTRSISRERDVLGETAPAVPAKDTAAPAVPAKDHESLAASTAGARHTADLAGVITDAGEQRRGSLGVLNNPHHAEPHHSPLAPLDATPEAVAANQQKPGGDLFHFLKVKKNEKAAHRAEEHGVHAGENPVTGVAGTTTTGSSATPLNEKRRSSFFNTLGRKDRSSDAEAIDGETRSKGMGGIFRKPSKSVQPTTSPVADSGVPPASITKDFVPETSPTGVTTEPIATNTMPQSTTHHVVA